MLTPSVIALIFGCILILVGLTGGGLEVKELKVPKIDLYPRIFAIIVGIVFIFLGNRFLGINQAPAPGSEPQAPEKTVTDCTKLPTQAEQRVCATPELSDLDKLLNTTFKETLGKLVLTSDRNKLHEDERLWINEKRNPCKDDIDCLKQAYYQRISYPHDYKP